MISLKGLNFLTIFKALNCRKYCILKEISRKGLMQVLIKCHQTGHKVYLSWLIRMKEDIGRNQQDADVCKNIGD